MSYFDELFGTPEITRRENWDGKEEPIAVSGTVPAFKKFVDLREPDWQAGQLNLDDPLPAGNGLIIDIDYEEVD